eukprot:scaffold20010_cov64-Phaeocystis_antarctica.AAC.4
MARAPRRWGRPESGRSRARPWASTPVLCQPRRRRGASPPAAPSPASQRAPSSPLAPFPVRRLPIPERRIGSC